jgi:uncharacterized protein YbjQ (UPF0145 family)
VAIPYANITTTNDIHGWEIQSYLGVVSSHLIAGTGFFSDVAAGFTDVFGGRSGTYQRQLSSLYAEALGTLQKAAASRGGNWILGLSVDFDEISGKNMQMFLVRATGTAVRAQRVSGGTEASPTASQVVHAQDLRVMQRRQEVAERAQQPHTTPADDAMWEFLLEHAAPEGLPLVLRFAAQEMRENGERRETPDPRVLDYLRALHPDATTAALYDKLGDPDLGAAAALLIKTVPLMRLSATRAAMEEEDPVPRLALQTLVADQATYAAEDLAHLDALVKLASKRFPDRSVHHSSRGLLGEKRSWTCAFCGNTSNDVNPRCYQCNRDGYGFRLGELSPDKAVVLLNQRRAALAALLEAATH